MSKPILARHAPTIRDGHSSTDIALAQADVRGYVLNHQRGWGLKDAWFLRCEARGWPYVTVDVGRRWAQLEIDLISMDTYRYQRYEATSESWPTATREAVEALWETELRYYEAQYPRRRPRTVTWLEAKALGAQGWRTAAVWSQFLNADCTRVEALADTTVTCLAAWIHGLAPLPSAPPWPAPHVLMAAEPPR